MADEEFAEPGDIQLSQFDRGSRWVSSWGRAPGSSAPIGQPYHPQQEQCKVYPHSNSNRRGYDNRSYHYTNNRASEAEDIMGHNRSITNQHKQALYYSPPGTSYTIVERSSGNSVSHHPKPLPRRNQLGNATTSSSVFPNHRLMNNSFNSGSNINKKRPISPEQLIKLFTPHGRNNNSSNIKSPSTMDAQTERTNTRKLPSQPPSINDLPVRTISMTRDTPPGSGHGFGICVKGGSKEPNNVGVYISRVEEHSIGEKSGLRPGDSILEVNGVPFTNISHEEALRILKSCRHISMTIKTTPLSQRLGHNRGGSLILRHSYSWTDRMGNPTSPPPDYVKSNSDINRISSKISKEKIKKIELTIDPGQTLGLVIRGGIEYGLGIFVTGVDKDSVAERSGLQIGDQILDVNGTSFLDITHDEAVSHLKSHNKMTITIRDVGKIPHSCATYDSDPSWDNTHQRPHPKIPRSETIQMIEEKARIVLEKSDCATFSYYLEEYTLKRMTFDTFLTVLFDLLDTPEKYTLMTELREVIAAEDKSKFDEIVYRRHSLDNARNLHNPRSRHTYSKANKFCADENTGLRCQESDVLRSPSEDSGLGLGPLEYGNGHCYSGRKTPRNCSDQKLHSDFMTARVCNEEDLGYCNQEYNNSLKPEMQPRVRRRSSVPEGITGVNNSATYEEANMCGYLEELRSHLGGWTQKFKDWYWGGNSFLAQKLGQGCDINDNNQEKGSNNGRYGNSNSKNDEVGSSEKNAHVVTDAYGNLRITVKKTKPLLGIAIEGGANTRHPLPRIINIHEHGAAFEAGGLEVGQLILEVDRMKVEGMQHQEVARMIAEIYANRDKPTIEFLVVEAKKSNMEPKPTALIFLDQ